MCNGRFDVNKYSEHVIQLFNDLDKVSSITLTLQARGQGNFLGDSDTHLGAANYGTIYTVGHKKRATFIFTITLANVDGFQ